MGPRRVGKTVMLHQAIQKLIDDGVSRQSILYVSLDTPIYVGLSLDRLLGFFIERHGHSRDGRLFVFFDEIQYLKDWEVHLKSLVDSHPNIRLVASGSAAAALRLRSNESGAGRFTDFLLPPLTFAEYIAFVSHGGAEPVYLPKLKKREQLNREEIDDLNRHFVDYCNFGGFPEAVRSLPLRQNPQRFIGSDIVDKVLLRDLPSLYGIDNTQELNRLFSMLAYNTCNEVNLESLAQKSGVAKNTLRRYIEYLEAAFLIRCLHRVDHTGRRFKRATSFKVYLTNPSLRTALFGPVGADDEAMGHLAETAVFCQWLHTVWVSDIAYARWAHGEVDFVFNHPAFTSKLLSAIEVKWSDRANVIELKRRFRTLHDFANLEQMEVLTRSVHAGKDLTDEEITLLPVAAHCYTTVELIDVDALSWGAA